MSFTCACIFGMPVVVAMGEDMMHVCKVGVFIRFAFFARSIQGLRDTYITAPQSCCVVLHHVAGTLTQAVTFRTFVVIQPPLLEFSFVLNMFVVETVVFLVQSSVIIC